MHLRGIGEMEVVQGDDDRLGVLVEFVDQACDDVLGCRHSLGRAQGSGVPQRATSGVVQRRGQVGEEQAGVLVGRLDRQPGDGRRGCACGERCEPLCEQRGLAEAGWCGDEDESRHEIVAVEQSGQPFPADRGTPGWRDSEPDAQGWHSTTVVQTSR